MVRLILCGLLERDTFKSNERKYYDDFLRPHAYFHAVFLYADRSFILLQIKNLNMFHLSDLTELVKELNFVVNKGEKVAIIGDEGTGKSSLIRYLNDDETINQYVIINADYTNHFQNVGYLPQILPEELNEFTVQEYIYKDEDPNLIRYDLLYKLASELDFSVNKMHSEQPVQSLSGGEKIKIQLIKILMQNPDLLLLDEPSNDLDLQTVQWLEKFIANSSLAIIYVSHDEELLRKTATKIIHLELLHQRTKPRATVAHLAYEEYIEQRQSRFQHEEMVANKQREDYQKKMEKHRQIEQKVHQDLNNTKNDAMGRLLKKKMASVKATGKRFEREKAAFVDHPVTGDPILIKFSNMKKIDLNKTILNWQNETIKIKDETLVESVDFHLKTGNKIGIVGANGVGKSTFLTKLNQELIRRTDIVVGVMPQNYTENIDLKQTAIEFLTQSGSRDEKTKIMTYLGSLRYTTEEMNHSLRQLSGGQLAKLWLAKFDLTGVNTLLLDEPTRNFSPVSQPELLQLFQQFEGTIVSISHDRQFLEEVCGQIYELDKNGLKQIK